MVSWMHSVTVGMAAIVNPIRRDDRRGQYGWPNSWTRQAVNRRLPTNNGFCGGLR
jgi:hypothetical protein